MIHPQQMKTKLLTIFFLLVTSQAFAGENSGNLKNIRSIYTENICDGAISELKKYESVICEVFRYAFFKYRDRKIDIPESRDLDYYTNQGNDILGFAYKKNTNKLFIIIGDYYYVPGLGRKRRGAIVLPLQNTYYPNRIYAVFALNQILVLPGENELLNIKTKNDIKSYKKLFPKDCLDIKNFYNKAEHKWWCR